jgi:membrane fusion protein, adhesin transport system
MDVETKPDANASHTAFEISFTQMLNDRGTNVRNLLWVTMLLLIAWLAWAGLARVCVYARSAEARLELDAATYPIQSPFVGRVVERNLALGQRVQRGDVLVALDGQAQQLELHQAEVKGQGYAPQLKQLRAQILAEQQAGQQERFAAIAAGQEADSRVREAEIAARVAEAGLPRLNALHAEKMVSDRALEIAIAETKRLEASVATVLAAARRTREEQITRDRERDIRVQKLQGELMALQAAQQTTRAELLRLSEQREQRLIRAPVSGVIAEVQTIREGAVLEEGDKLGSIVADDDHMHVVAQFPAAEALGRIRAGQFAVLRLDGFPWAEFGTVSAHVSRVAQEVRNGTVRVELALATAQGTRPDFILVHGMPGQVEIQLEHLSPWALMTRSAGQWLTAAQ